MESSNATIKSKYINFFVEITVEVPNILTYNRNDFIKEAIDNHTFTSKAFRLLFYLICKKTTL